MRYIVDYHTESGFFGEVEMHWDEDPSSIEPEDVDKWRDEDEDLQDDWGELLDPTETVCGWREV